MPSIIASFNLSLSTYLGAHKLKDMKNVLEVDTGDKSGGNYYFSKQRGFFPQMLEEVIKKRKQYKEEYKKKLSAVKGIVPAEIHDVVQTEEDMKKNIIKKDEVILNILRKGIVLWGQKTITKVIQGVYSG